MDTHFGLEIEGAHPRRALDSPKIGLVRAFPIHLECIPVMGKQACTSQDHYM
jgi:hypothetical protein